MKYVVELSTVVKCERIIEATSEEHALALVREALCDDDFNIEMQQEMVEGDNEQWADHNIKAELQLGHSSSTGTGGTLVRSYMNALDMRDILQRLEYNNHHNRGTVRIGNDTTGTVQSILGIAVRHHQGHIIVHTESRRIINHHSTVFRNCLGEFLRCTGTCRGKGNIHVLEVIVVLQ